MFELFYRWYTLGHVGLKVLCMNSLSPKVMELKVKNIPQIINLVICIGTHGVKKKHGLEELVLFDFKGEGIMWRPSKPSTWRMKNSVVNALWMQCEWSGKPLERFCVCEM